MDFSKLIADIREARRYVKSNAMEARRQVGGIIERLKAAPDESYEAGLAISRIITNLSVGSFFAVVAPEVFAGYLSGAAFELQARTWAIEAIGEEFEHA